MKKRLLTFLAPPEFDNEEKTLTAGLLYALFALVIGISLLLILPLSFFISPGGEIITLFLRNRSAILFDNARTSGF